MQNPAYFGEFGGMFVPELLVPALKQLENEFNKAQKDPEFQAELSKLLKIFTSLEVFPGGFGLCNIYNSNARTSSEYSHFGFLIICMYPIIIKI